MIPSRRTISVIIFMLACMTVAWPGVNSQAATDPESIEDLRAIQTAVQTVVEENASATVALAVGAGTGSGVVVSEDGFILTAAHVIGTPGRRVTVQFPDGSEAPGRTLGVVGGPIDAGMVKLEGDGPWPHVELADDFSLNSGDWVVALGHPGGFKEDRSTVVRLGRVIRARKNTLRTDSPLIGGDSGGPLFDLQGKLVGIHSRIGRSMRSNYHVPVNVYRAQWDDLVAGKRMEPREMGRPLIGISYEQLGRGCNVTGIVRGSGADKAGLKVSDLITAIDGEPALRHGLLPEIVMETPIGEIVTLTLLRDGKKMSVEVTVGRAMVR